MELGGAVNGSCVPFRWRPELLEGDRVWADFRTPLSCSYPTSAAMPRAVRRPSQGVVSSAATTGSQRSSRWATSTSNASISASGCSRWYNCLSSRQHRWDSTRPCRTRSNFPGLACNRSGASPAGFPGPVSPPVTTAGPGRSPTGGLRRDDAGHHRPLVFVPAAVPFQRNIPETPLKKDRRPAGIVLNSPRGREAIRSSAESRGDEAGVSHAIVRPHLAVAETVDGMVVNHSGGLHERVADGGADEPESPPAQVPAHRLG